MNENNVKYVAQFNRSFVDALTLVRNSRNQATIYYRKDDDRAIYDATSSPHQFHGHSVGSMIIRGRHLTGKDIPEDFKSRFGQDLTEDDFVFAYKTYALAMNIFSHYGISLDTGWDICP